MGRARDADAVASGEFDDEVVGAPPRAGAENGTRAMGDGRKGTGERAASGRAKPASRTARYTHTTTAVLNFFLGRHFQARDVKKGTDALVQALRDALSAIKR